MRVQDDEVTRKGAGMTRSGIPSGDSRLPRRTPVSLGPPRLPMTRERVERELLLSFSCSSEDDHLGYPPVPSVKLSAPGRASSRKP